MQETKVKFKMKDKRASEKLKGAVRIGLPGTLAIVGINLFAKAKGIELPEGIVHEIVESIYILAAAVVTMYGAWQAKADDPDDIERDLK